MYCTIEELAGLVKSVLLKAPLLLQASSRTFNKLHSYGPAGSLFVKDLPIQARFSPEGGIEQALVSLVQSAKIEIVMAAYSFTNSAVANALVRALKKGVKVSIVMDKSETHGAQAKIHDMLERAGAKIRLSHPQGGIMHDKYLVIDGQTVEWGSYNYTNRAEHSNFENATVLSDPDVAEAYEQNFNRIWQQSMAEKTGVSRLFARALRRL